MKTFIGLLSAFFMMSSVSALANDFSTASVEKTYIKCTLNEQGQKVPNYFVVVDGVTHQTDARTFHEIKKLRNEEKKNFANRQQNVNTEKEEKSNTL
ncbi:MAG: hypothetical protein MJZ00_07795 [Paludibacteraceae bacterium]|nr:hypothetical protein [Paludibacteraceae bacterium]